MRILFLCNTLYQIIGASCIRKMFPDFEAEIILSNHSTANDIIYKRLIEKTIIFDKAYYVESKQLYDEDAKITKAEKMRKLKDEKSVLNYVKIKEKYDMFFCANAEPFSERLVNYILRTNSKAVINWFEDGLSAYCSDKGYFPGWKSMIKSKIKAMLGIYGVTTSVDNYYVFRPEKMEWKPRAKLKRIAPLENELADELAILFDFKNCIDKYEEKYIFFEDGLKDWEDETDVKLVQRMAEIVGKDNILVKIHPRNPVNRFANLGFKTNKDMSVPWEVIASNIDIENKILVTMYSQSIVTPYILTGKKGKSISLGKLEKRGSETTYALFDYLYRTYFSIDSMYYVPETESEFVSILKETL